MSITMNFQIISRTVLLGVNRINGVRGFKRWVSPTLKELERRRRRLGPQPEPTRSQFINWNYKAEWYAFGKRLHEEFDQNLLQRAFTHRSYIIKEEMLQKEAGIENPEVEIEDNSILVEKGNAFMSHYIRRYISLLLPYFPMEGIIAVTDHLMGEDVLADISKNLGTKDLILCADDPVEQETLALTLKAVIGALLESSGAERTGAFVRDFVVTTLVEEDINELWHPTDPLSTLDGIMQRNGRGKPEPRLINEAGRNTILSVFHVGLYSDKQFLGAGAGETIPMAVEVAALDALRRLFRTSDQMVPFNFKLNPYSDEIMPSVHNLSISEWTSSSVVKN